jgi:hypothetical protein
VPAVTGRPSGRAVARGVLAVVLGLVAMLLLWVVVMLSTTSDTRAARWVVPALPLACGVAALIWMARSVGRSRTRSKIMVAVTALATLAYGALLVNVAPMVYGIGDAHNAWTLMDMRRSGLVPIEELSVGACMNVRYCTAGPRPRAWCSRSTARGRTAPR